MHIAVTAKPYARTASIEQTNPTTYVVRVDAPAQGGKANARLIELLAEYFGVPKSSVRIVFGLASREKIIEIVK